MKKYKRRQLMQTNELVKELSTNFIEYAVAV